MAVLWWSPKPDLPEKGPGGPQKPVWYVYDQFSFDPLVEFQFPNKEVQLRRVQTELSPVSRLYSKEIFSGETPDDPVSPDDLTQLGRYSYFYTNQRNDVTSILKHKGQSLHSYLYDEYGLLYDNNKKPRNSSNFTDPHNHYTFSSKEFDEESSLSYFGTRSYDAFSGTWTTQDIYRGETQNPSTLHRYQFVLNNPINLIDRYGFNHERLSPESPLPGNDQSLTSPLDYFLFSSAEGVAGSTPRFSLPSVLLTAKKFLDQLNPSLDVRPPKPGERLQRKTALIPQSPEPKITVPVTFTILTASADVGVLNPSLPWRIGGKAVAKGAAKTGLKAIPFVGWVIIGWEILRPECVGCSEPVAPPGGWQYEQSLPQEQPVPKVKPQAIPQTATPQPPKKPGETNVLKYGRHRTYLQ